MPAQPGYFSWVCFIDVQHGAWFGPIAQSEIDDYEYGFALDDNIKSWTVFSYYSNRPTDPLTCVFSRRIGAPQSHKPKTVRFADCGANNPANPAPTVVGGGNPIKPGDEKGTARLLLYNKTDATLFATLSEHDGRQEIPSRPNWAQWRFNNEYPNNSYLLKVFEGGARVYALDLRPVGRDIHITFYENSQGYTHRFEEPW